MAFQSQRWTRGSSTALAGAGAAMAIAMGGLTGALVAVGGVLGLASVVALAYAPLALLCLPIAICLWVPVIFFEGLPGATNAPEAGLLLLIIGWLAMLRPEPRIGRILRAHWRVLLAIGLFCTWAAITLLWAPDRQRGLEAMLSYLEVVVIYVIVLTALASTRWIRLLMLCFALGVAASVTIGLVGGGALGGALYEDGRLKGGMSDPNYLALVIVAALAMIGGLLPSIRTLLGRWMMSTLLVGLLLVGLSATGSRGGLIGAAAAVLGALWLQRGRRLPVVALLCAALAVGGTWFTLNPQALERMTTDKYGGSGRADLWQLAWREAQDHPLRGVGLDNFAAAATPYLREPGLLQGVKHIERGQEAHNLYLGLLAETGIIGLLLYLVIPLSSLRAAVVAGHRFEAAGDHVAAALARGVAIACIGSLAAAVFLPGAADKRLWVLYALGPALLVAQARTAPQRSPLQAEESRRLATAAT